MMDLQYLVIFNSNTKTIKVPASTTKEELYTSIKETFQRTVTNLQYFCEDWGEWIDVESLPPTKTKLKAYGTVETQEVISSNNTETINPDTASIVIDEEIPSNSRTGRIPINYKLPKLPRPIETLINDRNPAIFLGTNMHKIVNVLFEDMTRFYEISNMYPSHDDYVRISKTLVKTHPFLADRYDKGTAYGSWLQALKSKFKRERKPLIMYKEVLEKKKKYGHLKNKANEDSEDDPDKHIRKIQRLSEKSVNEAEGEDETSIKAHLDVLKAEWKKTKPNMELVEEKMTRTLSYRQNLAFKSRDISEFIAQFPTLGHYQEILKDFSRINNIKSSLEKKIELYMISIAKNVIAKAGLKPFSKPIIEALNDAKDLTTSEKYPGLELNAALLLIPIVFKEKPLFWITFEEPKYPTPTIKLPADDYLSAPVSLVIEKEIIECPNILKGVSALVAAYYTFQINYPKGIQRTLEFFQKVVAEVDNKNLNSSIQTSLNSLLVP